ncbi:MAG TPA: hypothetical protein PKC27_08400 [Methanomethylovorans sp.]|nr:hypothetical protein [Methanomethylovorans sp.]
MGEVKIVKKICLLLVLLFTLASCSSVDDLQNRTNNPMSTNSCIILYNSKELTSSDISSLKKYYALLRKYNNLLMKDVSSYQNAIDIYADLRNEFGAKKENISGVQIFGTSEAVPSFDIVFSIDTRTGLCNLESYKSDFFYSSFETDPKYLKDFSLHRVFSEKEDVHFIPEWKIARLPLNKGEYKKYFSKYFSYLEKTENRKLPLILFSNPITPTEEHLDDFGYFFKERLDHEFGIIKDSQYRIYGDTEVPYPIEVDTAGGFTKEMKPGLPIS